MFYFLFQLVIYFVSLPFGAGGFVKAAAAGNSVDESAETEPTVMRYKTEIMTKERLEAPVKLRETASHSDNSLSLSLRATPLTFYDI